MSRYTITKHISRLMVLLLCLTLLITGAPVARAAESGTCGDDLSWSFDGVTLTISGSGDMWDFPEDTMAPWYTFREEILRLELPDGLTSIGDLAFYECKNLSVVVIPNSVQSVGDYAFLDCTGLEMLTIGSGVRAIGNAAFSNCGSLQSLDLPESLTSIGNKGFYRCESITYVAVPASVTSMGVSVFAYCKNLVYADVRASITTLPEYMFYGCQRLKSVSLPDSTENISSYSFRGCESLNAVYYGGTEMSASQIQNAISSENPGFDTHGSVGSEADSGSFTSGTVQDNGDGTFTQNSITVTPGTEASVSTQMEITIQSDESPNSINSEITVTVNGRGGWDEAKDIIIDELELFEGDYQNVTVDVYVKNTDEIDPDFIEAVAGKPISVTITTQNGSVWRVDASQMDSENLSGKYNFSYTLTTGTEELSAELGTDNSFSLSFTESAEVNSEVLIYLGSSWAYQTATLFYRDDNELTKIQTVVVDDGGYAHFYLASVDNRKEYYIAMNLPAEDETPIVPEGILPDYGGAENYSPIEYVVTGRSSSWGVSLGQVMGILAVVMVSVVIVVGAVVYFWNKNRLKNGYVPELDNENE